MSRPLIRPGLVLLAVLAALLTSVALAGSASAHVTVSSADAAPGGYGKLTFRVPNESDTASTVAVQVQLPADAPLASVSLLPVPGWTATTTTSDLPEPTQDDDGNQITSYVSQIEWRADAGTGIAPGEFGEFAVSGGPFPDTDSLVLPVVQTYDDGTQAAWIEPTVEGQDEPENPAPVLKLTGSAADDHGSETTETTTTAADSADDDGNGTAVTALVLAIVGLVAGLAGLGLGLAARRRTVST